MDWKCYMGRVVVVVVVLISLEDMFTNLRERGRERERREKREREKHQSVASLMRLNWGWDHNLVICALTEDGTRNLFWCTGQCSNQLSHWARVRERNFKEGGQG